MSYIIAFVSFSDSAKEYPVQCFRTDLKTGDEVLVRKTDNQMIAAKVSLLKYLNWECSATIECRKDECSLDNSGNFVLPKGFPLSYGLASPEVFIRALKAAGWVPLKSRQRMYKAVLANTNSTDISYIFVRKNGVDIQILPRTDSNTIKPFGWYEGSLTEGKVVRHALAHTSFNLYEGILRFSKSFLSDEKDLERYFVPQGAKDKRTKELKKLGAREKASVQYVEYEDIDGWTIHKEIEVGDPHGRLEYLKERLAKGSIKNLKVKFGDKVPRDHFMGNSDAYWYGPAEAISGDF